MFLCVIKLSILTIEFTAPMVIRSSLYHDLPLEVNIIFKIAKFAETVEI